MTLKFRFTKKSYNVTIFVENNFKMSEKQTIKAKCVMIKVGNIVGNLFVAYDTDSFSA